MVTNSIVYVVARGNDVVGVYDSEAEARRVASIAKADRIWWCRMNWGCVAVGTNRSHRGWYQP
jgi:hypothetical protein